MVVVNNIMSNYNSGIRFKAVLFKDEELQRQVAINGYAVKPLLKVAEVEKLLNGFYQLVEMLPVELPDKHWTSGRLEDPVLRNFAREKIEEVLPRALMNYFDEETTDFVGGIYLAKKPSDISELSAHQDSSHTDENKYPSVYAWVPLVDTDLNNGAMHIIPGSHLWGNSFRSLNVPWLFAGMETQLNKLLLPIKVKAGEVLFFDSALIHYSCNNMSTTIRPALNYYIKPVEAPFVHYFRDNLSPIDKIEVYYVDVNFFYDYDFMQRPPCPPYYFEGLRDYHLVKPTEEQLISLYKDNYRNNLS